MCGIAGIYSLGLNIPDRERASRMGTAMAHRGPDGHGTWQSNDQRLILVHRRLSIIDLSNAAAQPMQSRDGNLTIVFNGEIYNYIEIREELKKLGYTFFTSSDTEVILQAYRHYGISCLSRFDGMFAFALWDEEKRKLICARDRFGEKPFYYSFTSEQFIFGSEIKAIRAYTGALTPEIDYLNEYLRNENVIDDIKTFFKDIQAMPPAHWMEVSESGIHFHRYWEIDLNQQAPSGSMKAYAEEFNRLFQESIGKRLRSDVAVGSSLSGGLDSSSIVSSLYAMNVTNMQTFSARFNSEKDEGSWMDLVNEKTGIPNHQVWPEENGFLKELDALVWHHEFPPGSASVYAQWCVMRLARNTGVVVLLDGQGADEYLAGYDELKYFAVWEFYRKLKLRRFNHERKVFRKNYGHHGKLGFAFLADPVLSLVGYRRNIFKHGMDLHEILKFYTTNKLGTLLRYADRNSMAHSVEVRLPFLNHKLVEFVFSLPTECIYREGKTKYILREAMKGVVPEPICNRTDKIGFAPPQKAWIESEEFQRTVVATNRGLSEFGIRPGKDSFRNLVTFAMLKRFCS